MPIIDCDRHVIEPIAMWREHLPPAYQGGAPALVHAGADEPIRDRLARLGPRGLEPLPPVPVLDGELLQRGFSERAQREIARQTFARAAQLEAATRPDGQLAAMDAAGVDVAFLLPTYAMYLLAVDDMAPARAAAFAHAYNSWLHAYCARDPRRLRGVGAIARHDPAAMLAELDRIAGLGWTAVVLRPNPVCGRRLGDPAHEPFWAACAARGIAVALHEGTHARVPTAGADRFQTRFAQHACSHPMELMMALLDLIESGVLERHPTLRVAFLEAGCGWVPYWLWRLDEEYRQLAGEVAEHVRMAPSAYFRRQCFVALEPDEPNLAETVRAIGPGCVVFGSDAPHLDHEADVVERFAGPGGPLSAELVAQIAGENPRRLFGIQAPG
ncbi:MAG TPA: amidohydrolase family protein [Kofleriaceae bacterium]|nr:amidohydrolase family protein [Kofleriaceae bacterium]